MNKTINKIPEYFKIERLKNDKRVVVFLICLLIATGLWFLNALSKNYSTTISYPVKYVNPPNRQFLANEPPSKFELKVDAHGFTLLRHKLGLSFSPIVLSLNNITRNIENQNGTYRVPSSTLMRRIRSQVSNEISILDVQPEFIPIVLDSLRTKTVSVKANINLNFKTQFNLKSPVSVSPAKVKITGPSAIIDTIISLNTAAKSYNNLDETIEGNLDIVHPKKTNVDPNKVHFQIEVEKYTEKLLRIPILIRNKPDSVSVKLFPSEVNVTCLVGLSEFDDLRSNKLNAFVDYTNIIENANRLEVVIEKKSSYIQVARKSPEAVEYLIEKN